MVHVVMHMARHNGSATSETIAGMLGANPVVVRRTMAGLRDAGFVRSEKGHGGGWTLIRDLDDMTIFDIYVAIGKPAIFAIGPAMDTPECKIEQVVDAALAASYAEAEALLLAKLASITLADLSQELERRFPGAGRDRDILACTGVA
jgi:DNA-binding IscR family transcriptional regulator